MEKRTLKFLLVALLCSWQMVSGQNIQFEQGSWQTILDKAAKEEKLVFFDAYTSWCGPCKWMAAHSFTHPAVAEFFNANFINASFDMEKGEGVELAKQFGVNAYPTLMFLDGQGTLVHSVVGARDSIALLELGKQVLSPEFMSLEVLQKRFESGNRSIPFLKEYILRTSGNTPDRTAALDAFKPSMAGEGLLDENSWAVFKAVFFNPDSEYAKYFMAHRADFEAKFDLEDVQNKARGFFLSIARKATMDDDTATFEKTVGEIRASGMPHCETLALNAESTWYHYHKNWEKFIEVSEKSWPLLPWSPASSQNGTAWEIYKNVDDKKLLKKAVSIVDKAIQADPLWEYMDTKAMLLFKLGKTKEGIQAAEQAIATAKEAGLSPADYADTQKALDEARGK